MRRLIVLGSVACVLVLLGVAQLVLPGIAEQRLRDRLARNGHVLTVQVSAFPAIELLWHQADRVVVRLASYRSTTGNLGNLLGDARDAGSIDASVGTLDTGLLTLHDAVLHTSGSELTGSARVTQSDLRAAVPFLDAVQPVASGNGQLVLRGTATVLGVTTSVDGIVAAQDGAITVTPDVPFGGLATVTAFASPHLRVDGVSATPAPNGFTIKAWGRLM